MARATKPAEGAAKARAAKPAAEPVKVRRTVGKDKTVKITVETPPPTTPAAGPPPGLDDAARLAERVRADLLDAVRELRAAVGEVDAEARAAVRLGGDEVPVQGPPGPLGDPDREVRVGGVGRLGQERRVDDRERVLHPVRIRSSPTRTGAPRGGSGGCLRMASWSAGATARSTTRPPACRSRGAAVGRTRNGRRS